MNKLAMGSKMGRAREKEKMAKTPLKMMTILKMPRIVKSAKTLMRKLMKYRLSYLKSHLSLNPAES